MVFFASKKVDMVLFFIVLFPLLMITGPSAVYLYIERKTYNNDMELTQFHKKGTWSFTSGVQNCTNLLIFNHGKIVMW